MRKELDLIAARFRRIDSITTVCLALGPYRNLTTLTAAVVYLHPDCQVLNHAGRRIFGDRRLDFLRAYRPARFRRFLRYALRIAEGGQRGSYGGSITFSHAFDDRYAARKVLRHRVDRNDDDGVKALFWKESLRTALHLRKHDVDFATLLRREPRLRFLMPIRNPLDCAASNVKTGHVALFPGLDRNSTARDVLGAILDEFVWFHDLRTRFPDRFFSFFQYEIDRAMLRRLADFLGLEPHEEWLRDALAVFDPRPSRYEHDESFVALYRKQVERRFVNEPAFARGLLAFVEDRPDSAPG